MFESAIDVDDPGKNAIRRLVGLYRVSALGLILGGIAFIFEAGPAHALAAGVFMAFSLLCAVGAWLTANGVEAQRRWARNAGVAIAILSLFSLGIGTIFGLIELYSLWRAQRSGQFAGPTNDAA